MKTLAQIVIPHADLVVATLPGIEHRTLADAAHGLKTLSVWRQTMAPGAATPPHRHDTEEVVLCHSGWGELHVDGAVHRFGPDSSVLVPRDRPHQIFNVGHEPMELTAIFATATLVVIGADNEVLQLPW